MTAVTCRTQACLSRSVLRWQPSADTDPIIHTIVLITHKGLIWNILNRETILKIIKGEKIADWWWTKNIVIIYIDLPGFAYQQGTRNHLPTCSRPILGSHMFLFFKLVFPKLLLISQGVTFLTSLGTYTFTLFCKRTCILSIIVKQIAPIICFLEREAITTFIDALSEVKLKFHMHQQRIWRSVRNFLGKVIKNTINCLWADRRISLEPIKLNKSWLISY